MRLPTQGPHRGDDTRAHWPMSIKLSYYRGACNPPQEQEKRGREGFRPRYSQREGNVRSGDCPRVLLVIAKIVRAAKERADEARGLGSPPHMAHPAMSAVHHFPGGVVHQKRTHLDRRIQ
jgi:hypothetical protein